MPNVIVIPLIVLVAVLFYGFFLFSRLKARWTTLRLFWLSLISVPVFFVFGLVLMAFWWPLAFDWDANAKTPVFAYIVVWTGIIFACVGVLAAIVTIVSGTVVLIGKISKADFGSPKQ
jgi:hypothetical protein